MRTHTHIREREGEKCDAHKLQRAHKLVPNGWCLRATRIPFSVHRWTYSYSHSRREKNEYHQNWTGTRFCARGCPRPGPWSSYVCFIKHLCAQKWSKFEAFFSPSFFLCLGCQTLVTIRPFLSPFFLHFSAQISALNAHLTRDLIRVLYIKRENTRGTLYLVRKSERERVKTASFKVVLYSHI